MRVALVLPSSPSTTRKVTSSSVDRSVSAVPAVSPMTPPGGASQRWAPSAVDSATTPLVRTTTIESPPWPMMLSGASAGTAWRHSSAPVRS